MVLGGRMVQGGLAAVEWPVPAGSKAEPAAGKSKVPRCVVILSQLQLSRACQGPYCMPHPLTAASGVSLVVHGAKCQLCWRHCRHCLDDCPADWASQATCKRPLLSSHECRCPFL